MAWYTVTQWVDRETGEILNKARVEREYLKIKIESITYEKDKHGNSIKKITKECEKNKQLKIKF